MLVGRLLDGESATGSFSVLIPEHASPGNSFHFSAYLLGGSATGGSAESSHLTLTVSIPPTPVASELDEGMFWVESYPLAMIMREGQRSSLFLQPVRFGITDPSDQIRLFLRVPLGIEVDRDSVQCGRGDNAQDYSKANCRSVELIDSNNHQALEVEPGFDVSTAANTVLIQLYVEDWRGTGQLKISGTLSRAGQVVAAPNYGVHLVSDKGMDFLGSESSALTAVIEHRSNFSTTGDACTIDEPYQIEVWSFGLKSQVDTFIVKGGFVHRSSNESSSESCFTILFKEPEAEGRILTLAYGDSGDYLPCRSCVMGSFPNDDQTVPLFIVGRP